jgi:hypothetical protein
MTLLITAAANPARGADIDALSVHALVAGS